MRDLLALAALLGLASAGTVSMPVHKKLYSELYDTLKITRRDNTIDLQALNNITGGGYYTEIGIGTPPQLLSFHLDTGSSDTWVNLKGIDFCVRGRPKLRQPPKCMKQFNPQQSETFKVVDRDGFEIVYLDGTGAAGDYFNDTVTIDSNTIVRQQQLGLARKSDNPTGLMGLGMTIGVSTDNKYPTIIDNLVSQGLINTPVLSLYLNSLSESHGSFLFGGIDTRKYIDSLVTLPLEADTISQPDNVTRYAVSLDAFSVDGISTPSLKTKAILDTGSTIVLLPGRVLKPVFEHWNVVTIPGIHLAAFIDCAAANKKGDNTNVNFKFNTKTISVPLREMIINAFPDEQDKLRNSELGSYFMKFDKVCLFGMVNSNNFMRSSSSSDPEYAVLGDTFLRSAYVVYDLAAQKVSLAQAYPKSNESNIVELKANSSLPDIKGMEAPPSSVGFVRAPSAAVAWSFALFAAVASLL